MSGPQARASRLPLKEPLTAAAGLVTVASLMHSSCEIVERIMLGPTCNGDSRPCTFGPGILGEQKCGKYNHRWDECVPVKEDRDGRR